MADSDDRSFNYMVEKLLNHALNTKAEEVIPNKIDVPIYIAGQHCKHTFIQNDINWRKCTHCGLVEPIQYHTP